MASGGKEGVADKGEGDGGMKGVASAGAMYWIWPPHITPKKSLTMKVVESINLHKLRVQIRRNNVLEMKTLKTKKFKRWL